MWFESRFVMAKLRGMVSTDTAVEDKGPSKRRYSRRIPGWYRGRAPVIVGYYSPQKSSYVVRSDSFVVRGVTFVETPDVPMKTPPAGGVRNRIVFAQLVQTKSVRFEKRVETAGPGSYWVDSPLLRCQ